MDQQTEISPPDIQRVRYEIKQRLLKVSKVENVTRKMLRITLTGEELAGFISAAPDDNIKIFPSGNIDKSEMRSYTPRSFNPDTNSLMIDFAIHEAGPATTWALNAKIGDTLMIAGPRGSLVISGVKHWLLIGDETALPAIGRRIEEAEVTTTISSIITVAGLQEEQVFKTKAQHEAYWIHRTVTDATDASKIITMLEGLNWEPETFIWVATEASVARELKAYLIEKRGHSHSWMRVSGYWVLGRADIHETLES